MGKLLSALLFILCVLLVGGYIGYLNIPTSWYQELIKPVFTPPNWLFAPVWTILYVIIGFVGWRVFINRPNRALQVIWTMQMLLNFAWSPLFFGLHQVFLALIVCFFMWVLISIFILKTWQKDRLISILFIPYLLWLTLATALNGGIAILN